MELPANAICAPDGSDRLAVHVGHTMNVHFGIPTRIVCGKEKKADDGCLPLVVSSYVNFGLGYFRVLSREDADHRADLERVESEHEWVRGAAMVVCVSPELRKLVRHKQHDIIKRFCMRCVEAPSEAEQGRHPYGRPLWAIEA